MHSEGKQDYKEVTRNLVRDLIIVVSIHTKMVVLCKIRTVDFVPSKDTLRKFVRRNFKTRKRKTLNNMANYVNYGDVNNEDSSDSDDGYLEYRKGKFSDI